MAVAGGLVGEDARPHFGFAHLGDPFGQRQVGDFAVARVEHERVAGQFEPDHQTDWAREHLSGDRVSVANGVVLLDQRDRIRPDRVARIARRES